MSDDIVDNRRRRLTDCVLDLLQHGAISARFAVGYLFLDGLCPLREALQSLPEIQILIGNVVNRASDEQILREALARQRGGEEWVRDQEDVASTLRMLYDRASAETSVNLRHTIDSLPRTDQTRDLLFTLAMRIADGGLKVRLYTYGRIHAKVTVVRYPATLAQPGAAGITSNSATPSPLAGRAGEGSNSARGALVANRDDISPTGTEPGSTAVAVVGSTNVTMASDGGSAELNVVVRDVSSVAEVDSWFDFLWDRSQDFHRELFAELGQSWALREPAV
ncbi:MAG: hypothetical protein ACLQVD_21895 [Capsulimonadaceae bacterium]